MDGVIAGLFTAEAAGEPMRSHRSVELVAGLGIPGDRYATKRGHWSDPRWPDQELTLVEAELLDQLGLPLHALRRNVVTRGIDLAEVIGQDLAIGDAVLRAVRPCDPCRYIETLTRPGLFRELEGNGGLRAAILRGGRVCVRDSIRVLQPAAWTERRVDIP
jgi:MOSC domain-containing protein YiiM